MTSQGFEDLENVHQICRIFSLPSSYDLEKSDVLNGNFCNFWLNYMISLMLSPFFMESVQKPNNIIKSDQKNGASVLHSYESCLKVTFSGKGNRLMF